MMDALEAVRRGMPVVDAARIYEVSASYLYKINQIENRMTDRVDPRHHLYDALVACARMDWDEGQKPRPEPTPKAQRTLDAIAYVEAGNTVYAACKKFGMDKKHLKNAIASEKRNRTRLIDWYRSKTKYHTMLQYGDFGCVGEGLTVRKALSAQRAHDRFGRPFNTTGTVDLHMLECAKWCMRKIDSIDDIAWFDEFFYRDKSVPGSKSPFKTLRTFSSFMDYIITTLYERDDG